MATKLIFSFLIILSVSVGNSFGQLTTDYYSKTCPRVYRTINPIVKAAIAREKRMGASLLRLHFHDCFVQGCDASLLLDDTPTFTGEKTAAPNNNSLRGFDIIDDIKSEVEAVCPGTVSCADILAIVARDAVRILGGPKWDVKVGRRDTRNASLANANSGVIPPPTATVDQLRTRFQARGLSTQDLVALSGAHTIGQARCTLFRNRIYNETNIDTSFAQLRQQNCPRPIGSGDDNLAVFDVRTPTKFDNAYYRNLRDQEGLLHSDQVLYNGGSTASLVETYSSNPEVFARDFAAAMIRMGDFNPLTGSNGEIRLNCRRIN